MAKAEALGQTWMKGVAGEVESKILCDRAKGRVKTKSTSIRRRTADEIRQKRLKGSFK